MTKRPTKKEVELAREQGYSRGRYELLERNDTLEKENKRLKEQARLTELRALEQISMSGATIIESMSRAFIAYKGKV